MSERKVVTLVCDCCGRESARPDDEGVKWVAVQAMSRSQLAQAVGGATFTPMDLCSDCGADVRTALGNLSKRACR